MTKVPVAGNVKTRLQPILSAEQCAALSVCFLLDAILKIESLETPLILAFSPSEKREVLLDILPTKPMLVEQMGANLGEKIFNAFQFAFKRNFDSIVMIGTDSPTFPVEFIERAFNVLLKSDAVLGKTTDGGFYLVGLRTLRQEIFENVTWSSTETFDQTARNIENLNFKLALLPDWYDVDTPEDFEILRADLTKNSNAAPNTFEFVKNFDK